MLNLLESQLDKYTRSFNCKTRKTKDREGKWNGGGESRRTGAHGKWAGGRGEGSIDHECDEWRVLSDAKTVLSRCSHVNHKLLQGQGPSGFFLKQLIGADFSRNVLMANFACPVPILTVSLIGWPTV